MVEKRIYKIIASIGAVFIYLFFAYLLVDFIKDHKNVIVNFGYNVEDAIVVELDTPEAQKPVIKKEEKKITPKPPAKEAIKPPLPETKPIQKQEEKKPLEKIEEAPKQIKKESRDIVAKSAKDLFSTVRTKKYDKIIEERHKQDAARASRLKKQKAEQKRQKEIEERARKRKEKALRKMREAMQSLESSSAASHKKSGVEDAFWSPVSNRIASLWERTIRTQAGLSAEVRIRIDNTGRLSYRIKRLSNNRLFDQKLQTFLENLEYETFPRYKHGKYTEKDILFQEEESL